MARVPDRYLLFETVLLSWGCPTQYSGRLVDHGQKVWLASRDSQFYTGLLVARLQSRAAVSRDAELTDLPTPWKEGWPKAVLPLVRLLILASCASPQCNMAVARVSSW